MINELEVKYDSAEYRKLQNVLIKLSEKKDNWNQELIDIGIVLLRSLDLNFAEQGRPPWDHQSQAAINRSGMTLLNTHRLGRSLSVLGDSDNIFLSDGKSLIIGTDVEYGKYLNDEWPFMMIQDEDIPVIEDIIRRSIEDSFYA